MSQKEEDEDGYEGEGQHHEGIGPYRGLHGVCNAMGIGVSAIISCILLLRSLM